MKLIAASATLLAAINAQSIEVLVQELVNKVYQVSNDGLTHTINAAPYLQATYTCLGEGFESKGTFGNGNGAISFTEKANWINQDHFSYATAMKGQIKSLPLAEMLPADVHEETFDSLMEFNVDVNGVSVSDSGTSNGFPYNQEAQITLNEINMARKKMSAEIEFTRTSHMSSSINPFWRSIAMATGSTTVNIQANAKTACTENPLSTGCSAKLVITGENNGEDLGKNVAKYSVLPKKAQFAVTKNKNEIFWMAVTGIDTLEVLALKYKVNGGKTVLAIQFAGPSGMEAVAVAAQEFIQPYAAFVSACMNNPEDLILAAVYSDFMFIAAQDKNLFNVYPVIKATQFESESLASVLGVSSVQSAARSMCAAVNTQIEAYLEMAAPAVVEARTYVHDVTGPSGEAKFDAWFAQF